VGGGPAVGGRWRGAHPGGGGGGGRRGAGVAPRPRRARVRPRSIALEPATPPSPRRGGTSARRPLHPGSGRGAFPGSGKIDPGKGTASMSDGHVYATRKFTFSSAHRYGRAEWSDAENRRGFGEPTGAHPRNHL